MADRIQEVARELNKVKSVGQARAAVKAAMSEIERGSEIADDLPGSVVEFFSGFGGGGSLTLTEESARQTLAVDASDITKAAAKLGKNDGAPVDAKVWETLHRAISRTYADVYGFEGARGYLDKSGGGAAFLGQLIRNAPGLAVEYIATAAVTVAKTAATQSSRVIRGAGRAVGDLAAATGAGIGDAAGGIGSGLGSVFLKGAMFWIIVGVVIFVVLPKVKLPGVGRLL